MTKTKDSNISIQSDSILLFDMDGTLIDTDYANFLSYQHAINLVYGCKVNITYDPKKRFNRSTLFSLFPDINEKDLNNIIRLKEINYKNFIHHTKLIPPISKILTKYYKTNTTILVTNCRKDRVITTLNFHNIDNKFNHILYREVNQNGERVNKYSNAIEKLNLEIDKIIAFENEEIEIIDALKAGINAEKIIKLQIMNELSLGLNAFLKKETQAFYFTEYTSYERRNKIKNYPMYLLTLKNDPDRNWWESKLKEAEQQLLSILLTELPLVKKAINIEPLVICVVPRSKADNTYREDQLLFKQTIKNAIKQMNDVFIDGTDFIKRKVNTKTTHLRREIEGYENDGDLPYPGISLKTCEFDKEIIGANILLIDDIYTESIGIDEDMIQALYDKGANSVTFYAIGRTV